MYCPFCQSPATEVTNSRLTKANTQVWRRRRCLKCKEAFTTHEMINLSHLMVVKKSGKIQRFNRLKLYSGIYNATIGFDMTNRENMVERISREAEQEILALKKKTLTSSEIADIVLYKLRKESTPTFLRFLAYCKDIITESQMKREFNKYTK